MAEREIFWNINYHWLFYFLAALSVLIFIGGCYRNIYVWFKGWPSKGTASLSNIFSVALKDILGNAKIFPGDIFGGLTHIFIMWGFIVLFLGTVLSAFDDYIFHFLKGFVYEYYALILDIFGLLFISLRLAR